MELQETNMPKASQEKLERRAAKQISDIILAGLERFPAKERKAKLDRMNAILGGRPESLQNPLELGRPVLYLALAQHVNQSGLIPVSNGGENSSSEPRLLPPFLRIDVFPPAAAAPLFRQQVFNILFFGVFR
jgi:hypothetical protein